MTEGKVCFFSDPRKVSIAAKLSFDVSASLNFSPKSWNVFWEKACCNYLSQFAHVVYRWWTAFTPKIFPIDAVSSYILSVHYRKKGNRVSRFLFFLFLPFLFLEHNGHLLFEGFPRYCQPEETLRQTTSDKTIFIEIYFFQQLNKFNIF